MRRLGLMAGHSENPKEKSREDELNLIYCKEIRDIIIKETQEGINKDIVSFICPSMIEIPDKNKALMEKIYFCNGKGTINGLPRCDILVDIHFNWCPRPDPHGFNIFYNQISTAIDKEIAQKSKILADNVAASLIQDGFSFWGKEAIAEDHTAGAGNLAVCSYSKMPTILIEVNFLSNPDDAANAETPEYRNKVCYSIYRGIKHYYGILI